MDEAATVTCPECGAAFTVMVTVAGTEEPRPRWRGRLLRLAVWVAIGVAVASCIWWVAVK